MKAFVPTGGQILGAVLDAFDFARDDYTIAHEILTSRRGRRMRKEGKRVELSCILIGASTAALFGGRPCLCGKPHRRVASTQPLAFDLTFQPIDGVLAFAIHSHLIYWDTRVSALAHEDSSLLIAFARLAAVHLGFAAGWLDGLAPEVAGLPDEGQPAWCEPKRRGEPVAALIAAARSRANDCTQAALASALDVTEETLRLWRRGIVRPTDEHLSGLAELSGDPPSLARVRTHYALGDLIGGLREAFGDEEVQQLTTTFDAIRRCRSRTRVPPGLREMLANFFLPFASWCVPMDVLTHEALVHAGLAWETDVRRASQIWRAGTRRDEAEPLAFLRDLEQLHDEHAAIR